MAKTKTPLLDAYRAIVEAEERANAEETKNPYRALAPVEKKVITGESDPSARKASEVARRALLYLAEPTEARRRIVERMHAAIEETVGAPADYYALADAIAAAEHLSSSRARRRAVGVEVADVDASVGVIRKFIVTRWPERAARVTDDSLHSVLVGLRGRAKLSGAVARVLVELGVARDLDKTTKAVSEALRRRRARKK